MSILRSSNCAAYTDTVSLLVDAQASVPGAGERCTVPLPPMFSCQSEKGEAPDDATMADLKGKARELLDAKGCDGASAEISYKTNFVGTPWIEYSGQKLADLGMASNCFVAGNDVNDATHQITARCRPMYDMLDAQGRTVRDYGKVFLSNLATCDVSDGAMPQLMEDARKVAAHNAAQNGFTVQRPEDLSCQFAVLPHL
jgi:hypothetical protein